MQDESILVVDLETTGSATKQGDRAIEIGVVVLEKDTIVDKFHTLMNPEKYINKFITEHTGITNDMVADAPKCEVVMSAFADFANGRPMVAHNCSFDKRFLEWEFYLADKSQPINMACSMMLARRLIQDSPDHKLVTLVNHCNLAEDTFHRALGDAKMTSLLWLHMKNIMKEKFGIKRVSFDMMAKASRIHKSKIEDYLYGIAAKQDEEN